jgi:two-component system, cell cycle sensor histidine kinase and response regulator CckA
MTSEKKDGAERPRKILVVEDNPNDLELLRRELTKGGIKYDSRCVETREAFLRELEAFGPDIVISDYALPTFDGFSALKLCRERRPELPFIFVSGTMGEETAVGALTLGATDYLLKGHTKRLCQAVTRAIQDAEGREARRKLEAQLAQTQRIEAIGRLAGGVAHDFNNLLTAINGYADIALARLSEKDPLAEDLRQIRAAGLRAAELTRQLLVFSRRQVVTLKVIDLDQVVRGVEKLLRRIIDENISITVRSVPDLGRVRADPAQLEQVIMNLAVNSRDAMPNGGTLVVETSNVELDVDDVWSHPGAKPGRYVLLAVSDTGHGMDKATLAQVFEPFFTTKGSDKGTGLGLAMVYGIVSQFGGSVTAYSEPGLGSTFKVYLPAVADPLDVAKIGTDTSAPAKGTETILLVEDEEMVRGLASRVLKKAGYAILEAANGAEALKLCEDRKGPIDLLVTDVVMPNVGGRELSERILKLRPGLKVLFLSGYTADAVIRQGVLAHGVEFLEKPFTPRALTDKVRAVLDQKSNGG